MVVISMTSAVLILHFSVTIASAVTIVAITTVIVQLAFANINLAKWVDVKGGFHAGF